LFRVSHEGTNRVWGEEVPVVRSGGS
jgi:hypothetical protein